MPKAALAGGMPTASFARFRVSMATFNEEIGPSPPFGRWEFASIVGNRGSCKENGVALRLCIWGRTRTPIGMGGHFVMIRFVQAEPFDDTKHVHVIDRLPKKYPTQYSLLWCSSATSCSRSPLHRWGSIIETPARHVSSTRISPPIPGVLFNTLEESSFTSSSGYSNVVAEGKRGLGTNGGCPLGCVS